MSWVERDGVAVNLFRVKKIVKGMNLEGAPGYRKEASFKIVFDEEIWCFGHDKSERDEIYQWLMEKLEVHNEKTSKKTSN